MFLEEDGVEKPDWSPGLDWKQTWASFFHPPEFICVALSYNMEPFNSCSRTATAATYFQFPGFASVLNKHCYKQFYKPSPRVHVRVKLEKSSDRSTHLMLFILACRRSSLRSFFPHPLVNLRKPKLWVSVICILHRLSVWRRHCKSLHSAVRLYVMKNVKIMILVKYKTKLKVPLKDQALCGMTAVF